MSVCLSVRDLTVRYGPVTALSNVDLNLSSGEILFVTGPNGAGKSTLLRAIAGAVQAASGSIELHGRQMTGSSPEMIVSTGFTLVPEGREIFDGLSVRENLYLGAYLRRDNEVADDFDFVLAELPALKPRLDQMAGLLSGGQQQMLAIGRALMTRAKLIAFDEPSLGLAPIVIDGIYDTLTAIQSKRSLTLLIAEQSFSRAVELRARLALLRNGRLVRDGHAAELASTSSLENAYFGF